MTIELLEPIMKRQNQSLIISEVINTRIEKKHSNGSSKMVNSNITLTFISKMSKYYSISCIAPATQLQVQKQKRDK